MDVACNSYDYGDAQKPITAIDTQMMCPNKRRIVDEFDC